MYFPLSDVTISPILLAGVGFLVGLLGGFFGVGGGFLAGPMMLLAGVPGNFVVGTDLAHMTGKSIVAARRHSTLGHVDLKLGGCMIAGTAIGIELGAQVAQDRDADLLVIGSAWAAQPAHRFFVRNVTEKVLLNTQRPVLVVRPIA